MDAGLGGGAEGGLDFNERERERGCARAVWLAGGVHCSMHRVSSLVSSSPRVPVAVREFKVKSHPITSGDRRILSAPEFVPNFI